MSNRKKLQKISIALLVLIVSVFALYWLGDFPSFTSEMAFRRKEKAQLIGPAQIIDTKDFEHSRYDHMIIGKSDYGYTFFEWNDGSGWDEGVLTYFPKAENVTLYCTKYAYASYLHEEEWLPIFAFTDSPASDRAKLTLEVISKGEAATYTLEADRNESGYFLFSLPTSQLRNLDFWLIQQLITGEYDYHFLDGSTTAIIELFDNNDNLIQAQTFTK